MRRLASAVAVVLLLGCARTAAAQDAPEDYASVVASALTEFGAGHFAEARALFYRAHALQPSARTWRGIGMAAFELREYVEATRVLGRALTDPRHPLEAAQVEQVRALLARAEGFVGRYTPAVEPADADVRADGQPVEREDDGTVLLAIGHHAVTARAAGHLQASTELEVRGGERAPLALRLEVAPAAHEVSAAHLGDPTPHRATAPRPDDVEGSAAPYVWLGLGGAFVLGAVGAGIWWLTRGDELSKCFAHPDLVCSNLDSLQTEQAMAGGLTIGLSVLGAGAAIVGAVLLLDHGPPAAPAHASVTCAPGLASLVCAGTF